MPGNIEAYVSWWAYGFMRDRLAQSIVTAGWWEQGEWELMVHWVQGGKDSKGGNLSLDHKELKNFENILMNTHTYHTHAHAHMHGQTDRHIERQRARETETDTHRKKDRIYLPLFWLKVGKQLIKFADQ